MAEEIEDNFLYSPYTAAIADKDEAEQKEFFERFYQLPQAVKDVVASPQMAERIQALFAGGIVPEGYELAIAKIIMFVALKDVSAEKIPDLLPKLGIPADRAQTIAQALNPLIQDIEKARATPTPPPKPIVPQSENKPAMTMPTLPPMTRPTESGPKPLSPQPPGRNIIDLRKK